MFPHLINQLRVSCRIKISVIFFIHMSLTRDFNCRLKINVLWRKIIYFIRFCILLWIISCKIWKNSSPEEKKPKTLNYQSFYFSWKYIKLIEIKFARFKWILTEVINTPPPFLLVFFFKFRLVNISLILIKKPRKCL